MNSATTESLFFLNRYIKELSIFALPFLLIFLIPEVIGASNPKSTIAGVIYIINAVVIIPFYNGFLLLYISSLVNNENSPIKPMFSKALSLWLPLFLVSLFSELIILSGFFILILPGIWLIIRLFLAPLYAVFQGLSASQAIKTAYRDSSVHTSQFFFALLPVALFIIFWSVIGSNLPEDPSYFLVILSSIVGNLLFIFTSILQYRLYTKYIKITHQDYT